MCVHVCCVCVCVYVYVCMVCAHRGEKESSSGSRLTRGLQSVWHHLLLIFIKERELHHHRGREEDQGNTYPSSSCSLLLQFYICTVSSSSSSNTSPYFYVYVTFRFCVGVCLLCTTVYTSFVQSVSRPLRMYIHTCTRVHCIAVSRV